MNQKQVLEIMEVLKSTYPEAKCSLSFTTPIQMGIAVMLSAQCTDARVNMITPILFDRFKTVQDYANADVGELEKIIHSCGFYKNKAKNIKKYAEKIIMDFDGIMPQTMEELIMLPGIGRKSANVIMLEAYNNPQGIAVDTHAKRVSNRLRVIKRKRARKNRARFIKNNS